MLKKIIISEKEYTIKFPAELQNKTLEIYVFPTDYKYKITKKIKPSYFQVKD